VKNKIYFRLLLYFSGSLLTFSLLIGLVFFSLFSRHSMDLHKTELGNQARRIAHSLAGLETDSPEHGPNHGKMGRGRGYGSHLRFLNDLTEADVWIVDLSLKQIERGHGQASLAYQDLPPGAENVILAALDGRPTFSENFGAFLGQPSLTVATPIILPGGEIAGAVVLHEQIESIWQTTRSGLLILLFSMGTAIVVSFFIAGILARHFTRPLRKMKTAALKISGGDYRAATGVAQDDEIGELAGALDRMAAKLDLASRESAKLEKLRRDFVANISHELRTPVTVIRGSLEALHDGVVSEPDTVADYHRQMLTESIYLERLITDLLNLARLQNPDFVMDMQAVNLPEIAADALRGMRRGAQAKNVALKQELDTNGGGFTLQGDYGRLRQMLMIVLDNAIKFSPAGATVGLQIKQAAKGFTLSVHDNGPGIPPAELPHIFERFHRQRSEENKTGTGLGLAIAKQIAARHGVTIEVRSEPGRGTTFYFHFVTS
jgi:signal transduction histidine kinase